MRRNKLTWGGAAPPQTALMVLRRDSSDSTSYIVTQKLSRRRFEELPDLLIENWNQSGPFCG